MKLRGPGRQLLTTACLTLAIALPAALSTACVRFDNTQSEPFTTKAEGGMAPETTTKPPAPLPGKPFPKECPAPGVMQGCLQTTSGLIMGSGGKTALVAERTTGAIVKVSLTAEPVVQMVIPVDPSGDGGLLDIVQSPTFYQDRLTYALVSTPTDNRVVRIAEGDVPKDILTGIPKGAHGNTGSLLFSSPTTLLVQTGDAGDPGLAGDPASKAGKVLRIEQPTTVDQAPTTTALSGLGPGGGMCTDPADGSLYVTDRAPAGDRLQRITKEGKVSTVWTWPAKPGVAGCVALDGTVLVNLVNTKETVMIAQDPKTGAVTGDPEVFRKDTHGHAWALKVSNDGNIWGATVNRSFDNPGEFDDVVFPLSTSGGFPQPNEDMD